MRTDLYKKGGDSALQPTAGACPLDDNVIYGLVLRAFAGDGELEFTELNQRCHDRGFPGGAQAVTMAIVRKYVGVRNGWNGLPYTTYLTGRQPTG